MQIKHAQPATARQGYINALRGNKLWRGVDLVTMKEWFEKCYSKTAPALWDSRAGRRCTDWGCGSIFSNVLKIFTVQ